MYDSAASKDVLAPNIRLPNGTKIGDRLTVLNAGAYFLNSSMCNTLAPVVVLINGEKDRLIRQREKPEKLAKLFGYNVSTLK